MKTKIISKICVLLILSLNAISLLTSCQPEDSSSNGLSDSTLDASFTINPISGTINRYVLKAQTTANVLGSRWNLGDGSVDYIGKLTDEIIFLPDAGTYTISHTAIGKGGTTSTASQTIVVANSDPISGNIVRGGKFQNASDHNLWTILNINGNAINWTFNIGSATISGGSWDQKGLYQAVEVVANKSYKIDMQVSGSGAQNTWFEVYVSPTPPVQNTDYTAGGRRMGLSTWDGCATSFFSGKLSTLGCIGSGNVVSFNESGTIYLLIKSGGENLGSSGISVTNIEMRGM
jgi:hypothetical protein